MWANDCIEWYQGSTRMLGFDPIVPSQNSSEKGQRQEHHTMSSRCDCFRPDPFVPEDTYENRFVKKSTSFGEVNLIYLQCFTNIIRMNQQYLPFSPHFFSSSQQPQRCQTGECNASSRHDVFKGDLNATLWNVLPKLNTTHAFVNLGWELFFKFPQQSKLSCCVIRDFERHHPDIKIFLISHPPRRPKLISKFDPLDLQCGDDIDVLDRTIIANSAVSKSWYTGINSTFSAS
jgi:hypothetical protein